MIITISIEQLNKYGINFKDITSMDEYMDTIEDSIDNLLRHIRKESESSVGFEPSKTWLDLAESGFIQSLLFLRESIRFGIVKKIKEKQSVREQSKSTRTTNTTKSRTRVVGNGRGSRARAKT